MQVMFRPFGLFLIIFASFTSVNAAPRPLENALDAVQQQNWQAALQLAAQDGRIATDIIEWHLHRSGAGTAQAVSRFMDRNSDWPGLPYLQKQSEQAFLDAPTDVVLNFFQRHAPVTAMGGFAHAAALLAEGKTEQARQVVQDFWVSAPMSYKVQQAYLDQFSDQLSRLHDARLAEMLWQDAHASAEAILPYVSSKQAAMAKARIALRKGEQGVDPLIAAVADELQESPLLAHARFTWRLRAGRQDAALALLIERSQSADLLGRPEVWSKGRKLLVRELISERRFDVAYQLASSHHLTKGSDFADLEWLAGYIALRHHNSPTIAQVHFENLLLMSETPISLSRGYYWLGVAHQVQGNEDTALRSFRLGADYQIAFYGLLCAEKIAAPVAGDLSNDVALPDWQDAAFRQSPVF
ncbi:MAG: lytic transglycosylase domain-containing protein, partial [Paracoccaceae bacterium]